MKTHLRVALLGCGTIGSQVAKRIIAQRKLWRTRLGIDVELEGIAVRCCDRERPGIPADLFTQDAYSLINSETTDVVVELLGGCDPARDYIVAALRAGKPVVSANKELISQAGPELIALARENSVPLLFEAAVGGAIPIMRVIEESLLGDQIVSFKGIVNGTTNYILDQMGKCGTTFSAALKQAQDLGFAEADPTADIEGLDAAAKAAILATESFYECVHRGQVACTGISRVTDLDVQAAAAFDMTIKLLAKGGKVGDSICVEVAPTALPNAHPLAGIGGAANAIYVEAQLAGTLLFTGQGAGPDATASAVLGDVINALLWASTPGGNGYMSLTDNAKVADNPTPAAHLVVGPADMSKAKLRDLLREAGLAPDRLAQAGAPSAVTLPTPTTQLTGALAKIGADVLSAYRIEEQ